MKVETYLFGSVEISPEKVINFPNGLVGFEDSKRFMLAHEEGAEHPTSFTLQSLDDPNLAFQIADDILDVTGDATKAGKRLQKDAEAGKATFVSLLGLDAARARAAELVAQAESHLQPYGAAATNLIAAARFAISRET